MSKHAVMPITDYVNACDALREKTGTTEPIKSGDIPKKVNDVYDMGKLATLKDSRYMNGKESGTIVSVNDVTPIEHNVGVKLSSDTITDFTGVEVTRYEKNLVNIADKIFTAFSNGYLSDYIDVSALKGNRLIYQFYADFSNTIENTANAATRIFIYDENKTLITNYFGTGLNYVNGISHVPINLPDTAKYVRLGAAVYFDSTNPAQPNSSIVVKNIQLEISEIPTEYEPYTETIYTANADGTVEGVKSISPNMTLIPNNNAVTVECEYLRDIDLYIDNLLKSVAMIGGE